MEKHPFLGFSEDETHFWCLHCECVWPIEQWQENDWSCPDRKCDGSPLDTWAWSTRRGHDTDFPSNPPPGSCFPLYP